MKKFWKSKTFWLNLFAAIGAIMDVLPMDPSVTVGTLGVANIALRSVTKVPLTIK